jgi:AraC-like DNA-binding protein
VTLSGWGGASWISIRKVEPMTDQSTEEVLNMREWTPTETFDDFALMCCRHRHLNLLTDPDSFSLTLRAGRMGPVTLSDLVVGSDISIDCGEACNNYRVLVLQSGRTESVYRGVSVPAGPGTAAVYAPDGVGSTRWAAGAELICFKIDRSAVDDALSDALGRRVTSQIDFTPVMPATAVPTRSWINMLLLFREQLFRPNSLLNQPLVGLPFADSLVRGFLLAADHSHRNALARDERPAIPRVIRVAVELIEEEAHLPLTLSIIAARCHVSARSLQHGFRRHLGTTPMAYLREVRLRRAHRGLREADPSTASVASVAYRWGFTNLGRFAAAHAARYDEPPAATLRRRAVQRNGYRSRSAASW